MDTGVVLGLVVAAGSIIGSTLLDGGKLAALFNPSAALLVVGGTLGVTTIAHSLREMLALPSLVLRVLHEEHRDEPATVALLVEFAVKARREGLLSIEDKITDLENPFLRRGLQMVVDGVDPDMVRNMLQAEIANGARRGGRAAQLFETAGGYAPTMGIIGTVMGLIHVLSNLDNAASLGPAIAVAFLATFYGIGTANVFWLPLAAKLKAKNAAESAAKELILEGVLSIQRGDNPSIVRDTLNIFLEPQAASPKQPAKPEPAVTGGRVA